MTHKDYSNNIRGIGVSFCSWCAERALARFIGREITPELQDEMAAVARRLQDRLLVDRIRLSLFINKNSGIAARFDRGGLVTDDSRGAFAIIPGNIYTALVVWGVTPGADVDDSVKEVVSHSDGIRVCFRWSDGDTEAEVTRGSGSAAKTEKATMYMGYDEKTKKFGWPHELVAAGCI